MQLLMVLEQRSLHLRLQRSHITTRSAGRRVFRVSKELREQMVVWDPKDRKENRVSKAL